MAALHAAEVPFLIGGAYMVEVCGGVSRSTKDFDLYVRPNHVRGCARSASARRVQNRTDIPALAGKGDVRGRYA